MSSILRFLVCGAFPALVLFWCAAPAWADDDFGGLIFEQLGPGACEVPPAEITPESFNEMAATSPPMEAGAARGQLAGAFDAELVGTALFGRDQIGGLAVATQGIFRSSESEVLTVCVALLRLAAADDAGATLPLQAELTGKAEMNAASPGAFLALVRFMGRTADGSVHPVGSGSVNGGSLSLREAAASVRDAVGAPADTELLSGTLQLSGEFQRNGQAAQPLRLELSFPAAPQFLKTVPRLTPSTR